MSFKSRNVCWTLNNYGDADIDRLRLLSKDSSIKYIIWGKETAPSTGTLHLQGYTQAKSPLALLGWKKRLGSRVHIEASKGNFQQNFEYCSKDKDFEEHGERPAPGKRTDLQAVAEKIRAGASIPSIADEFPTEFIRYHRGLTALKEIYDFAKPRDFKTVVRVYVGRPGVGKSQAAAREGSFYGEVYYKPNGAWWDGYTGQPTVILDDFYGGLPYNELLHMCDRYPHKVPVKGAFREFRSRLVIITSNNYVEEWYKDKDGAQRDVSAFLRRVTEYCEMCDQTIDNILLPWHVKGQLIDY